MFLQTYGIYGGETLAGPIDWQSVINQGFAIGSQIVGAIGKRPTTQIASGQSGIFAVNPPAGAYSEMPPGYYQLASQQQTAALLAAQQNRSGLGADDALGSVLSFVQRNPLFVGAIALGLFLLFKEPPRRR